MRGLLKSYLDQRLLFYKTRDANQLEKIDQATTQQTSLWAAPAAQYPTAMVALAVSGMNDVLDSQGYTLAAWNNRIPLAAWVLMGTIAGCSNILIGYGAERIKVERFQFLFCRCLFP